MIEIQNLKVLGKNNESGLYQFKCDVLLTEDYKAIPRGLYNDFVVDFSDIHGLGPLVTKKIYSSWKEGLYEDL